MARPVASTPHLVWAGGHFLVLLAGLRYLFSALFFWSNSRANWYYNIAYLGAIVSYGVVVYKSFGVPQLTKAYFQKAAMDENVQYFLLSLYWTWHKPIAITLIPFVTFSLFHVLTFARTTIIPMAFPTAPSSSASNGRPDAAAAASGGSPPLPKKVGSFIQTWVKANYEPAMRFVAYSEVAIFLRLLFGFMLWRNGLIAPLIYAHFLRLRFYMSTFTRAAFTHVGDLLDHATRDPRCPPAVRKTYLTGKDLISRYASSVLSVQNQTPSSASSASGAAATGAASPPSYSASTSGVNASPSAGAAGASSRQ